MGLFRANFAPEGYLVMPVLPPQGTAISKSPTDGGCKPPLLEAASDANQLWRFAQRSFDGRKLEH
jgi:hypothetical protein